MLDQSKPHKGRLEQWFPWFMAGDQVIIGLHLDHAITPRFIHTSWIVKQEGDEIETLNSRYTLIGEKVEKVTAGFLLLD